MPHSINISELGGVARAFAEVAETRWPGFLEHATVENGSLRLDVLSPSRATYLRINASIDCDEIIIGIGGGHSHGGPWEKPGDPDYQLEASIRFIDDILADRIVGCSHYGGGGSIGTIEYLQAAPWWPSVEQVRSWTGVHDEDHQSRSRGWATPTSRLIGWISRLLNLNSRLDFR